MSELALKYELRNFYLKKLNVDDVNERYLNWVTDPIVTEYLAVKYDKHTLQSLREFVINSERDNSRFLYGIFTSEDLHIGNFSLYNINRINETFDFGYFIGEKDWWGKDAGLSCCLIGLRIAFDEMNLRKTFTYVESTNLKSRFVLQKIGFIKEAVLTERVLSNKRFVDSIVYSLNKRQWEESVKVKFKIK